MVLYNEVHKSTASCRGCTYMTVCTRYVNWLMWLDIWMCACIFESLHLKALYVGDLLYIEITGDWSEWKAHFSILLRLAGGLRESIYLMLGRHRDTEPLLSIKSTVLLGKRSWSGHHPTLNAVHCALKTSTLQPSLVWVHNLRPFRAFPVTLPCPPWVDIFFKLWNLKFHTGFW